VCYVYATEDCERAKFLYALRNDTNSYKSEQGCFENVSQVNCTLYSNEVSQFRKGKWTKTKRIQLFWSYVYCLPWREQFCLLANFQTILLSGLKSYHNIPVNLTGEEITSNITEISCVYRGNKYNLTDFSGGIRYTRRCRFGGVTKEATVIFPMKNVVSHGLQVHTWFWHLALLTVISKILAMPNSKLNSNKKCIQIKKEFRQRNLAFSNSWILTHCNKIDVARFRLRKWRPSEVSSHCRKTNPQCSFRCLTMMS